MSLWNARRATARYVTETEMLQPAAPQVPEAHLQSAGPAPASTGSFSAAHREGSQCLQEGEHHSGGSPPGPEGRQPKRPSTKPPVLTTRTTLQGMQGPQQGWDTGCPAGFTCIQVTERQSQSRPTYFPAPATPTSGPPTLTHSHRPPDLTCTQLSYHTLAFLGTQNESRSHPPSRARHSKCQACPWMPVPVNQLHVP